MCAQIAVIDIGKTNAKLTVLDETGERLWQVERSSPALDCVDPAPLSRGLDLPGIDAWLLEQLSCLPDKAEIRALVPIAHGAAMVMLGAADDVLLAPDYEDLVFNQKAADYACLRPVFTETLSPCLPGGLNLGRQIYTIQTVRPDLFERVRQILLYPQYWAWRFSGVAASELTSLGCHTDLWNPEKGCFSSLARGQGWDLLFPPVQPARAVVGSLRPDLAALTGLSPHCQVICGVHDSNASYLAHLVTQPQEARFSVISSGTWSVVMSKGAAPARLVEAKDMLANVDVLGRLTPTARFMGGREYAFIAGSNPERLRPSAAGLSEVLAQQAMALPAFAAGGPFQGQEGQLLGYETLSVAGRLALASLYCALMGAELLENLGSVGAVLVDGPFAADALFPALLQSLRPQNRVVVLPPRQGTSAAALWLAGYKPLMAGEAGEVAPLTAAEGILAYRGRWREMLKKRDEKLYLGPDGMTLPAH